MKTIKQFREEYDNVVLDQVQIAPDELMLEGRESSVIKSSEKAVPSPSVMPTMLLFRRVAYRQYPGKQVVALYYSKIVNKYLSIPFGPDGNLNLSEAIVLDEGALGDIGRGAIGGHIVGAGVGGLPGALVGTAVGAGVGAYKAYKKSKEKKNMKEDWSDTKHQSPTGGLKKSGVMAYRRENPGSKLQTAVTTKPSKLKPGSKAANRRKSFCARMGGMKKRLTSAKTARDPDSRINKALRKWNCEESFKVKLNEMRQTRLDEFTVSQDTYDKLQSVSKMMPGYKNKEAAKKAWKSGDYVGAAKEAGKSLAKAALTGAGVAAAVGLGARALPAAASALSSKTKDDSGIPSSAISTHKGELIRAKSSTKTKSSWEKAKAADDTFVSRQKAAMTKEFGGGSKRQVAENKISDIQNMLNEGIETLDLSINGRSVTLNNSMAKKIIRVYESVNTKNKKIVESMLNEDLDSFKKLLNFSIKA